MNNRHTYKKFTKILPVNNWRNIAKLLTISIFITAFGVAFPKAAYAFLSSVDGCLVKPDCAAALGLELAPVVSNVVKGTVVVTGVCSLSSEPCSIPRYYWNAELNQQAQELAKQKYCIANPSEVVCAPPYTGGQCPVLYHYKFHEVVHYRRSGYPDKLLTHHYRDWQPAPGPIRGLANTYPSGYWGGGYGPDSYYVGWIFLNDGNGNNQQRGTVYENSTGGTMSWDEYHYIYSNNNAEKGWLSDLVRADGLPDNCGNPPPLAWKDWPQEKRNEAVKLISPSDWQVITKYMPKGEDLKPGDVIKGLVTIVVQVAKDNFTTKKDESLQPKTMPGLYKVPLASDSNTFLKLNPAQKKRVTQLEEAGRLTRAQVDKGQIDPQTKCLYFQLPVHLGDTAEYPDHGEYATHVTGSAGDFFVMSSQGTALYQFYDGVVRQGGAVAQLGWQPSVDPITQQPRSVAEVKTQHRWLGNYLPTTNQYYNPNPPTPQQRQRYNFVIKRQIEIGSEVAKQCRLQFFMSFSDRQAGLAAQQLFQRGQFADPNQAPRYRVKVYYSIPLPPQTRP